MNHLFFQIALIAILSLGITSCSSNKETVVSYSDARREGLKGYIKLMKTSLFACDSAGNSSELQMSWLQEFNEDGNMVKHTLSDKEGKVLEVETKEFHENGLVKNQVTARNGQRVRSVEYPIDQAGRHAGLIFRDSAGVVQNYITDYIMNEFGQPVSFSMYDKDSTLIMKEQSTYRDNKLLHYFQTDSSGRIIFKYEYRYDHMGECIQTDRISLDGDTEQKETTTHSCASYDSRQNCTKRITRESSGKATNVLVSEFVYREQN